jgi:hypothetical protein
MLSRLKSTHAFKQELSSGLEWTILNFKLTYITFHHGACSRHSGLEQLKDRTVKSSAMSQALWSTIILKFFARFLNKTQRFLCMTLSCLSSVVFLDLYQGIKVCAFSLLSRYVVFLALGIVTLCLLSLTLLLIGIYGAHRWGDKEFILVNIYCIVRPWIQRDKSGHTVKSRCACVWS